MGLIRDLFPAAWKGFGITLETIGRKTFTQSYPEKGKEKVTAPRFHGRHQLNRWPDGLEKCVGCEPVSYTHLDVYKRQVERGLRAEDQRRRRPGMSVDAKPAAAVEKSDLVSVFIDGTEVKVPKLSLIHI